MPIRIEIGPRDLAKGSCVTCRRDRLGNKGKEFGVPIDEDATLVSHISTLLQDIQDSLLQQATLFRDANVIDVTSYDELKVMQTIFKFKSVRRVR